MVVMQPRPFQVATIDQILPMQTGIYMFDMFNEVRKLFSKLCCELKEQ